MPQNEFKPLPGPLPEGEHVLWQQSPLWQPLGRRVFHTYKIALYFSVIIAWVAVAAALGGGLGDAWRSLIWTLPPALGVVLLLGFFAWAYSRNTVYTITNKRVIIQSGLAFTTAINLPFAKLDSADMKTFSDGSGDIELTMSGPRILYSMIWPNNRLFAIKRPRPVLWALSEPRQAAEILSQALVSDERLQQAAESAGEGQESELSQASAR